MKKLFIFSAVLFNTVLSTATAQVSMPKGFEKGSILLTDSTVISGFVKDNIRSKATVTIMAEDGGKKSNYDGNQLIAVEIDSTKFICIKGDFFKVFCEGDLSFLQKSSDASGKPVYLGNEAVFTNGTPGRPGDYFLYRKNLHELQLVTNKNFASLTAQEFVNCEAAISKAKQSANNIAELKDAVIIYNNRSR